MKKRVNRKQLAATALLFLAGIVLGLAIGLLIIPKSGNVVIPVETKTEEKETATASVTVPVLGNPDSKVRVVEFSDLECPYCKDYFHSVFDNVMRQYIDKKQISYEYADFPLEKYPHNVEAANALYCAAEQNRFWEMYEVLFEQQQTWSQSDNPAAMYNNFIQEFGIDTAVFSSCYSSQKYLNYIQLNIDRGNNLQITVTPTVFVNDIKIEGLQTPEYYRQIINGEIERTSAATE